MVITHPVAGMERARWKRKSGHPGPKRKQPGRPAAAHSIFFRGASRGAWGWRGCGPARRRPAASLGKKTNTGPRRQPRRGNRSKTPYMKALFRGNPQQYSGKCIASKAGVGISNVPMGGSHFPPLPKSRGSPKEQNLVFARRTCE